MQEAYVPVKFQQKYQLILLPEKGQNSSTLASEYQIQQNSKG
jgi:hypothetical protein